MRAYEFISERKSPEDIYLDALARLAKAATKRYKRERLRQHVKSANTELNQLDSDKPLFNSSNQASASQKRN